MSFICDHNKEVAFSKCNIIPKEIRIVHYNNYETYMRGNKLVKQYTGTTTGVETAKEMKVCDECMEKYYKLSEPAMVGEKNIMTEYSHWPIREEEKQNAIVNNRIIIIDTLPQVKTEKKPIWEEDYIGFEDEPSRKYG